MNFSEKEELNLKPANVLTLFQEIVIPETPSSDLSVEDDLEFLEQNGAESLGMTLRKLATEDQFPDQSLYILDEQLSSLRESLARIKFYLGDIDDLLPR